MSTFLSKMTRTFVALLMIVSMGTLCLSVHHSQIVDQVSEHSTEEKIREATGRETEDRLIAFETTNLFTGSSSAQRCLDCSSGSCFLESQIYDSKLPSRFFVITIPSHGPPHV